MADIKQAAKWMQEGRTVRRTSAFSLAIWRENYTIEYADDPLKWDEDAREDANPDDFEDAVFDCEDLLADDWELVHTPETPPV